MNNDYLLGFERNAEYSTRFLARIMHRFLSRSDAPTWVRCATREGTRFGSAPANVLHGTLRRPTEGGTRLRVARAGRMISSVQ